jgi:hypothetical protein
MNLESIMPSSVFKRRLLLSAGLMILGTVAAWPLLRRWMEALDAANPPPTWACSGIADTLRDATPFGFWGGMVDQLAPYEDRKIYIVEADSQDVGLGTVRIETRGPRPVLRILYPSGKEVPSQPDDYWGMTVARSLNVEEGCYVFEVSYPDGGSHTYFLKTLRDRHRLAPERMSEAARRHWEQRPRPR